ncbi:MAG: cache domain-containing protein [Marmoricola sp.]
MTQTTLPDATVRVRDQIADILTGIFETLMPLKAQTHALFADAAPTAALLTALDPLAIAALQREDDLIVGAGYVAAPGAVSDSQYWLEWWSDYNTPRTRRPERLVVEVDPHSESFNDYTRLPWYAVPALTHQRHLAGPYVDYLCTDEYTLTATIPIVVREQFVGVVGADVYANTLAQIIEPLLAPISGEDASTLVVNSAGRVLAADDALLTTGDLVDDAGLRQAIAAVCAGDSSAHPATVARLADLPFALVNMR